MSKVFGTIAAVFLAAAAFVAFKNQEALVKEAGNSKENIKGLLQVQEDRKASNEKEFAEERQRLATAEENKKEEITAGEKAAEEYAAVKSEYDAAKKKVESLEQTHANNEREIASMEDAMKGLPDPNVLIPKIKRMTGDLAEANTGIDTEEAELANLTRNDASAQKRVELLRDRIKLTTTGKSYPTLNTRISSIYRNWGFVILSAGDSQGVITGSTLDVIRGGEVIAKLKVTAVESGRSAADIILDSVAEGTTLRVGDRVVAEKEAATTAPAAAPSVPSAPVAPPEPVDPLEPEPAEEPAAEDDDPF